MGFKLKQKHEVFTVVDGPFAGHTYRHGQVYDEVPPQEKHKFDKIVEEPVTESKGLKVSKKNSLTVVPCDHSTDNLTGGQQS